MMVAMMMADFEFEQVKSGQVLRSQSHFITLDL